MTWSAFLQIARIRAVEETDADGKIWDAELKRAMTREAGQARGGLHGFLQQRATLLSARGAYASVAPALQVPQIPSWLVMAGWAAAFVAGWCLAALGQASEINLLALPLIGILLWNAVVILLSLWPTRASSSGGAGDWRSLLLVRFDQKRDAQPGPDKPAFYPLRRFRELVLDISLSRFSLRFRTWLHIGAALLALGSISGMYARGWAKEYHAVWESTLLDEKSATKFFEVLFTPASAVTGQSVPLEELPGMRRHARGPAKQPGGALPWIHLYAATLGLFVFAPRLLLAVLDISRARAVPLRALQSRDWQEYAQRLSSLVDGAGAPVLVLTHGLATNAVAQDRWRHWAYLHWRDLGPLQFESVSPGTESDFAQSWLPSTGRVMLVFNMAATPEKEVQRFLVDLLIKKLKSEKGLGAVLLLALDDADLRKRWSGFADLPARVGERSAAWQEAMNGSGAIWHEMAVPGKHAP